MSFDNVCKLLAEKYPADFVRWLIAEDSTDIKVLKTELSIEPIRISKGLHNNSKLVKLVTRDRPGLTIRYNRELP
jgi:predicted transposase YdaD